MVGVCPRVCQICLHYNKYEGFVKHFGYQFRKLVDMVFQSWYIVLMNAKPLAEMNEYDLTIAQVARRAGLSWGATAKALHPERRMGNRIDVLVYVAIVAALDSNWRDIRLGELFADD